MLLLQVYKSRIFYVNDWFVVASPSPILPHLNRKSDIDILDSSLTYLGLPKSNTSCFFGMSL